MVQQQLAAQQQQQQMQQQQVQQPQVIMMPPPYMYPPQPPPPQQPAPLTQTSQTGEACVQQAPLPRSQQCFCAVHGSPSRDIRDLSHLLTQAAGQHLASSQQLAHGVVLSS